MKKRWATHKNRRKAHLVAPFWHTTKCGVWEWWWKPLLKRGELFSDYEPKVYCKKCRGKLPR